MKKNKTSNHTNKIKNVKHYIHEGDNRVREVCDTCGFINYTNPKIIVGAVIEFQKKLEVCLHLKFARPLEVLLAKKPTLLS